MVQLSMSTMSNSSNTATMFNHDEWKFNPTTGAIKAGDKLIAEVAGATIYNMNNTEAMANARLIELAPQMYALLETITSVFQISYALNLLPSPNDSVLEKVNNSVDGSMVGV